MFVLNAGGYLGEAIGWNINSVGVNERDGKLDLDAFAEGAADLDVEEIADAEEAAAFDRNQAGWYLHLYREDKRQIRFSSIECVR